MDTSLCSEIEAVLGPDSLDSVSQEGSQCSKTSNSSDKPEGPQEEGKVDDMIVDQEDTSNKTEASNSSKDLPSAEQDSPPQEQPVSTSDDQQEERLNVPPIHGSQRNSVPPSTGQAIQGTRNVIFAATEGGGNRIPIIFVEEIFKDLLRLFQLILMRSIDGRPRLGYYTHNPHRNP